MLSICKYGTKVMPIKMARDELFEPTTHYNINSKPFVIELAGVLFAEVDK